MIFLVSVKIIISSRATLCSGGWWCGDEDYLLARCLDATGGEKRHMVEEDEQARAPARQQRTVFARGTRHQGNRQPRILKTRFIDVFLLFTPLAHPDLQY